MELKKRLAGDLDAAFADLVQEHLGLVFGVALRATGNPHDAEEVSQDAFENAYRALRRYTPERVRELRLRPWLAKVTLNAARTRTRRKQVPSRPLGGIDVAGHGDPALNGSWEGLVAGLPPKYRDAVVLRYVEDMSYDDVALALGIPVGTVKTNVHRGVRMLREALEQEGARR